MGGKDYMDESALEKTHNYGKKEISSTAGGWPRDHLRNHLGMKPLLKKKKTCLNCSKDFDSYGERLCNVCKKRRWKART